MQFAEGTRLSQVVRGVIIAILITLLGVLLFAFLLSVTNLSDKVIKPVNQFIKLLSVFFACFLTIKEDKGFIKGGVIGIISSVLCLLIFALISGVFNFFTCLIDVICAFIMGGLSGVITVNVRKR